MSAVHGRTAKVYVNGYDVSGYLDKVNFAAKLDTMEDSRLGASSKHYAFDVMVDATLSATGFFEWATSPAVASHEIFEPIFATEHSVWSYLVAGDAFGSPVLAMDATETEYQVESSIGGLCSLNVSGQSNVGSEAGKVLHPLGAVTVTGNGTVLDNGASPGDTVNGGAGYLHVTDVEPGGGTVAVKVQHSSDNTTWVDLITFATASVVGAQRVEVAGTVHRYVRAQHTLAGGATTATYHLAFARK